MPVTFVLPVTFFRLMKAQEDYANHPVVATGISFIRYIALLISIFLPAIYLAMVCFHQEMMPTKLALTIIASEMDVRFSAPLEIIGMIIALELLLEAGLHLPKSIGQTVSIVGALVVGQAAVQAKMVSTAVVIVLSITAVTSFALPNQDFSTATRLWRFFFVLAAALSGLIGIAFLLCLLIYHLSGLESFGVAYLTPLSVNSGEGMFWRTIIRWPLWMVKTRPAYLGVENERNQK